MKPGNLAAQCSKHAGGHSKCEHTDPKDNCNKIIVLVSTNTYCSDIPK